MFALSDALATGLLGVLAGAFGALATLFMNERRVRRQYRLDLSAEALARELLTHRKWRLRNFATIKRHMGGFADDELRQILVRAGAVRFAAEDGGEWWGLLRRNRNLLSGKEAPPQGAPPAAQSPVPPALSPKTSVLPEGILSAAPNAGPGPMSVVPAALSPAPRDPP